MTTKKFAHLLTHSIRGKIFRLIWRRPPKTKKDPKGSQWAGQIDSPKEKFKELWIWPDPDPYELTGTVIHECTHGAFPDIEENAVREHERDIMRLLKRMGAKITFEPI